MKAPIRFPAAAIVILAIGALSPLSCYYGPSAIVRFDPNYEGAADEIPPQTLPPGSRAERPDDPYREGYLFNGWYKEAEAIEAWDFDNDIVESALTLYAGWEGLPPEENAFLASLAADRGSLNPSFKPSVINYTLSVGPETSSVTLTGMTVIEGAQVNLPLTISDLVAGEPRMTSVVVTATNGTTTKTYNLIVRRATDVGIDPEGRIVASRTEGVAPLFVHFTSGVLETEDDSSRFLRNEYQWDFGDPESGTWGTNGKPRNLATGGVTAHVFDRPGTYTVSLTVKDIAGNVAGDQVQITVLDPEAVYAGEKTVCVSDIDDFTGAPPGSRHVVSTNLSEIAALATAGTRILFRRGGQWTAGNIGSAWVGNNGPVTIGAYGAGINPDALGIYQNAPKISLTGNAGTFFSLNSKRDWRVMDLWFDEPSGVRASTNGIDASYEYRDILVYRMRVSGFNYGICWSHWNRDPVITIERNAIVSCYIHDQDEYGIYAGSERLAVMGNRVRDVMDEHVMRIWQAWHSVISHNLLSGASLDGVKGDHAMKLHGPGIGPDNCLGPAVPNTYMLEKRTDYVVVSDNAFGSCGPWPVMIAPTNQGQDENLSNIVFERNRIATQFGVLVRNVDVSLRVSANRVVIRNNVIDGTGSSPDWIGIMVTRHGVEPPPTAVSVYNNTIYRADNGSGGFRIGIQVGPSVTGIEVANNLVSFPNSSATPSLITDDSGIAVAFSNLMAHDPFYADPGATNALARDFRLLSGSPAIDTGAVLAVYDDFNGVPRPFGPFDVGATEQ